MTVQVLNVSSKGQIVLPAEMRKKLSISNGDKLIAYASDDAIMLKPIAIPSEEELKAGLDKAQEWARKAGYQESDVNNLIKSARKAKRK